jgi:hypothetical protein
VHNSLILIPKYDSSDQAKEEELGGACGTHGRVEESVQGFGGKSRRKETTRKNKLEMGG